MARDLTNSQLDRQNILNNDLAVSEIHENSKIECIFFENQYYLTKAMVADFFEVELRTVERYVSDNASELISNGYEILKGKRLKDFLEQLNKSDVPDINVGNISNRTPQLAVFNFRAFLNIAMLISESNSAKILRKLILDIVIDLVNQKTGGGTKYINQRDKDFLGSYLQEENYRKEFTDALRDYVDMGNLKYALFTDKIYQSIFKEKSVEYRKILRLQKNDKVRNTLYSEVLDLVASYECGLAGLIKEQSELQCRKLNNWEVNDIYHAFEILPHWKPLIHRVRTKMASRDLALRDAFHSELNEYIQPLHKAEYEKFLGSDSEQIEQLMAENQDVLMRLKGRE